MSIKVGGLCKVKSWEEMEREYGLNEYDDIDVPFHFTREMIYLCNKIVKIAEVKQSRYNFKIIDSITIKDEERWNFSEEMLKPIYSLEDMLKDKNLLKEKDYEN